MTKALYDKGREGFLDGSIDWDTDDIRVFLVDLDDYAVDLAAHTYVSDIPAVARVAMSPALASKTKANGVAGAGNPTFPTVVGDQVEAVVISKWTGSAATSRLIAYWDEGANLPVQPNGGDIVINFDPVNKIFKL